MAQGYNFQDKKGSVTTVVTTASGKVLTNTTNKGWTTTSTINKIFDSNGNEIGTITSKGSVKNPSKVVTKSTKSVAAKGMYGDALGAMTSVGDWYETQNSDKYKKKKSGVVVNTSKNDYEMARQAARNRYEKNKKQQDVFASMDILKNEVPTDIKELQDKMNILFTATGLTIQTADPAVSDNEKRNRNKPIKKFLRDTLESLYNVNYYKEGDPGSTTSPDKHVSYILERFDTVFNLTKYDHKYASDAFRYILNDLISVNRFNVLPNNKPLNSPPIVNNDITTENLNAWIEYAAEWLKDLFHANGRFTPEDRGLAQASWINAAINDSHLNTTLTTATNNISSLSDNIATLKSVIYDTFINNYIGDLERQIAFYNNIKSTTLIQWVRLPLFKATSTGSKYVFTSKSNKDESFSTFFNVVSSGSTTRYDGLSPIFQKERINNTIDVTTTSNISYRFFDLVERNISNYSAYVEGPSATSFTHLVGSTTDFGDAPMYFCNIFHYFIRKILKLNNDLDENRSYVVYQASDDPLVDAELRMSFLREFIDFIRIAQGYQ